MNKSPLQADVLGQLLVIQQTLDVMPNADGIASFLNEALKAIPGVKKVHLCLEGKLIPVDKRIATPCDKCNGHVSHCDISQLPGYCVMPLRTARNSYGFLVLTIADEPAFNPYRVFLENIANEVAMTLQTQDQIQKIDRSNKELEDRVKERTRKLRESEVRFRNILEFAPIGMAIMNLDGKFIQINSAFCNITGYPKDELHTMSFKDLVYPEDLDRIYLSLNKLINGQPSIQSEKRIIRRDKSTAWVQAIGSLMRDNDGNPQQFIGQIMDISEIKQNNELIWWQANYDELTSLPNRRLADDRLALEIKKSARSGESLALLFIDLDRFKDVNDTLGHRIGDELLKEAARRIVNCVRESDTVARLGGDEFIVMLTEVTDIKRIELVAQNLIDSLQVPFQLGDEKIFLSASIGISVYPNDAKDSDNLLRNADRAMYLSKSEGRNRFSYFTKSMQEGSRKHLQLIRDLHSALQQNQFLVYFQPIIDLKSGTIIKAEALIRWNHPMLNLVLPGEFIPVAEEIGLINEIGDWVFRESIRMGKRWSELLGYPLHISINVSPVQFMAKYGSDNWINYANREGISGENIIIEITEGILMKKHPEIDRALLNIHNAGIQVAIDDFGVGYSSLAYLKKFKIDYLKIDQSFTRNLSPNSSDLVLSEAIIIMAHKLGIKVIAEGIETEKQRTLLTEAGCDFGQGYLFSRPLPSKDFEKMLLTKSIF